MLLYLFAYIPCLWCFFFWLFVKNTFLKIPDYLYLQYMFSGKMKSVKLVWKCEEKNLRQLLDGFRALRNHSDCIFISN